MIDFKGILYWISILFILWLLWPLIKWLIIFVLIAAIAIYVLNKLNSKKEAETYIEREDYRKPNESDVIEVEYVLKDKDKND